MGNLSLDEIMGLIDGATTVSPLSSQQPSQMMSLDEITTHVATMAPSTPEPKAPSAPTAYDELAALQTKSTGLNSAVRGVLQLGSNAYAAFGDFETAANLDLTAKTYFAPEAPNFQDNTGTFAYESIASNAPQLAASVGLAAIPIVGIPLAIASIALPMYGESRKAILEGTGQDDPYAALLPAAVNTALDLAVPMRIAKKLGLTGVLKDSFKEASENAASYIGKETLKTAGLEGATEVAQWASNLATVRFLTDKNVLGGLTPGEQQDALNNFFGGMFGGGGFGLGAAAYTSYKAGKTKEAVEREISDLDSILNGIKLDPNTPPNAPAATESQANPDAVLTPTPTETSASNAVPEGSSTVASAPTTEAPAPSTSEAKPAPSARQETETVINKIRYSIVNRIKGLDRPLYEATVTALEARRKELLGILSGLDTEINMKAMTVPSAYDQNSLYYANRTSVTGHFISPVFFQDVAKNATYYAGYKDGKLVDASGTFNPDVLTPTTVFTNDKNNLDQLSDAARIVHSVLDSLGLSANNNPNGLMVIINDLSHFPAKTLKRKLKDGRVSVRTVLRKGSASYTGSALAIDLNVKHTSPKELYSTLFHELGHYVAVRITHDIKTNKESPEADALRAEYANWLKGKITNDRLEFGVPTHQSQVKDNTTAKQARTTYATSFDEWLAEGFRQAMLNRVADGNIRLWSSQNGKEGYFNRMHNALQRMWRMSRRYVGSSEAGIETFQNFVDRALFRKELIEVEAKLKAATANEAAQVAKEQPKDSAELPKETLNVKPKDKIPANLWEEWMSILATGGTIYDKDKPWSWSDMYSAYANLDTKFKWIKNKLSPEFHNAMRAYAEMKANAPKKGKKARLDSVSETLDNLGMKKQANNVEHLMEVNMGILGDSTLGRFFRSVMTPLQVAEQADNRGFSLGRTYMEIVQRWQLMKTTVVEMADSTLKQWRVDGKESTDRISRALYIISTKSDEINRRLTPDELKQVFDQLNMTQAERDSWEAIDKSFQTILDQMWDSTLLDIARTYNLNPKNRQAAKDFRDAYKAATSQTERNILVETYTGKPLLDADLNLNPMMQAIDVAQAAQSKMRDKNYFPRSRMGEYVVRIKASQKGSEWDGHVAASENETVGFYAFDTEQEQRDFMKAIAGETDGLIVLAHKLDSEVFSVMGLPAGIIDQIVRDMDSDPRTKLSALQRELLNDIALQRSPGKKFLRHMTRRRGIAGYSEDAIRVYANYMSMASNHLARSEYAPELSSVITAMNTQIQNPGADFALVNDWNVLKDYFVRHFDYIMKPDNDWATLRSVGFLWYLGFNVKSAIVNLMQTPMVTLPVLSRDVQTTKAAGRLATAMKDIVTHLRKRSTLSTDELSMIDYMLRANLIDESLVSELAGLGEADALKRLVPGMNAQSVLTKVSWYGGAMFRMGEKFNRYTTALASYRIARQDLNMDHEKAIQYSVEAIQSSQFEYAKFNRPQFMRGKKSVIFLFWQYMQHASYLFFGGKGSRVAKRMWLMALAIAGLEGLPFAQLLMKTIDFTGTAVRDVFGVADPRVETNKMIRELISNIYDRPDDIMKGMSYQWGLGPFHLLRPLGVPVPNVTTEGSLGFGNPVPWFDSILDPTVNDMDKALGQTAATMLGPIGGMVLGVVEALGYSKEEDNWKRWEKTLPVFMKNASQGIRWMAEGEETTSNGMQVVPFETPEQRAEIALKTLGFTPTRIDQTRRQMRAAQESLLYYQARKQMLMDDFWYARQTGDREVMADARQAIRDYNAEVREAKLGQFIIKGDSLVASLSERAKARAMSERGISSDRRQEALRKQAEKLIPVTAGN